jgi:hypothetical protein
MTPPVTKVSFSAAQLEAMGAENLSALSAARAVSERSELAAEAPAHFCYGYDRQRG